MLSAMAEPSINLLLHLDDVFGFKKLSFYDICKYDIDTNSLIFSQHDAGILKIFRLYLNTLKLEILFDRKYKNCIDIHVINNKIYLRWSDKSRWLYYHLISKTKLKAIDFTERKSYLHSLVIFGDQSIQYCDIPNKHTGVTNIYNFKHNFVRIENRTFRDARCLGVFSNKRLLLDKTDVFVVT